MSGRRGTGLLLIACLVLCGFIAPRSRAQTNGLRTEYYLGSSTYGVIPDRATLFSPNNLRRVGLTTAINYNSGGMNPPANGLSVEYYGIRWLAQIQINETGDYVFYASSHDGFRFWLGADPIDPTTDAPLLDVWDGSVSQRQYASPSVHLEAGVRYHLLYEMYNNTDLSYSYVHWKDGTDLPTNQLYPEIPADQTAPGAISDLTVVSTAERSATVRWTTTGDDSGNAAYYDIRYSFAPIDSSNFDQATPAIYAPAPAAPGATQSYEIAGLRPLQAYHFAMRVGDAAGNLSAVSNDATGTTQKIAIPAPQEHGLLWEAYYNVRFNSYSGIENMRIDPRYPGDPDEISYVPAFNTPSDIALDYSERVRGYVTPPQTGDYVFWITADDCGELFLSPDEDPAKAVEIALVPDWELSDQWDKFVKQQSDPIHLDAGKRYYVEALHGQIQGGSHLTVKWRLPDDTVESPIPTDRLTPLSYPHSLGRVDGVVKDADGSPVSGVRVLVTRGDHQFGSRTDSNGYFTTMAPSGLVQVSAYQPDSPYDARASVITAVSPDAATAANFTLSDYSSSLSHQTLNLEEMIGEGASSYSLDFTYSWLAVDANNNLFFASMIDAVGKLNANGDPIPVMSGDPILSYANVNGPRGMAFDHEGDLFIADTYNSRILKLTADASSLTVYAGTGLRGFSGDGGPATNAQLYYPNGIAIDAAGDLFIADWNNNRIRKVDTNGVITTVAGDGDAGYDGDGGQAVLAKLHSPMDVKVDSAGNLYIADTNNYRVRKVDANGVITTIVGTADGLGVGNAGRGVLTGIKPPLSLALDALGNLFISTYQSIYKLKPDGYLDYYSSFYANYTVALNSLGDLYISHYDPYADKSLKTAGPGLLTPVSLSVLGANALSPGGTVQLAATDSRAPAATPSDFKWSVAGISGGSAEVGRVDANGSFKAPLNAGTYVLTAERDGAMGALKATVVEPDAPLLSLGSATVDPSASASVSISATAALSDVSGLDLTLQADGPDGAPALTPTFEEGADAAGWQILQDPGDPWHFTILNPSGAGLSGPAELMTLTVTADASAPREVAYAISARSLLLTTSDGRWRTNRARVSSGSIAISKQSIGDVNGDGTIDVQDVTLLLKIYIGLTIPTAEESYSGDMRPKPGIGGRLFGDGRIGADDLNWLLRRAIGLEAAP